MHAPRGDEIVDRGQHGVRDPPRGLGENDDVALDTMLNRGQLNIITMIPKFDNAHFGPIPSHEDFLDQGEILQFRRIERCR